MCIDSDMAVREALECFREENNGGKCQKYLTLHAANCMITSTTPEEKSTKIDSVGSKVYN